VPPSLTHRHTGNTDRHTNRQLSTSYTITIKPITCYYTVSVYV